MITSATILMAAPAAETTAPATTGAESTAVAAGQGKGMMMQGRGMGKGMAAQGMKCAAGKCGHGMAMMHGKKMVVHSKKIRMRKMHSMKRMHSPFLIKHGLPHLSKMIMFSWSDPAFGLTAEQKSALEDIRKKTMGSVMKLKKEILPLTRSIIVGAYSGKGADTLGNDVKKLGQLEAEATIIQLQCIEETKKILSKDQLIYLLQKSAQHKKMMHKMR